MIQPGKQAPLPVHEHSEKVVSSENITKVYGNQTVLDVPESVVIRPGFTAIVGESGSGKSTYLNILAGFVTPTTGEVTHYRHDTPTFHAAAEEAGNFGERLKHKIFRTILPETPEERRVADYRAAQMGYIAQQPAMHPYLTMGQYTYLTHQCKGNQIDPSYAATVAEHLGITALLGKKPSDLSGGEEQRGAILAALVHKPNLVFADEPTSALDPENSAKVMGLFQQICVSGASVVMVTHNPTLAEKYADTILTMERGHLNPSPSFRTHAA